MYKRWQVTWEECRNVRVCYDAIRRAKAHLKFNLTRGVKDNKKDFLDISGTKTRLLKMMLLLGHSPSFLTGHGELETCLRTWRKPGSVTSVFKTYGKEDPANCISVSFAYIPRKVINLPAISKQWGRQEDDQGQPAQFHQEEILLYQSHNLLWQNNWLSGWQESNRCCLPAFQQSFQHVSCKILTSMLRKCGYNIGEQQGRLRMTRPRV